MNFQTSLEKFDSGQNALPARFQRLLRPHRFRPRNRVYHIGVASRTTRTPCEFRSGKAKLQCIVFDYEFLIQHFAWRFESGLLGVRDALYNTCTLPRRESRGAFSKCIKLKFRFKIAPIVRRGRSAPASPYFMFFALILSS